MKILAFFLAAVTCAGCDAAMSPLHEAAISGDTQAVQAWIARKRSLDVTYDEPSHGVEGNASRMRGVTPLMLAAGAGQLEVVKLLVEGGANLYAEARPRDEAVVQDGRRNAFDYAIQHAVERGGDPQIAQYFWAKSDGVRFRGRLDRQIFAACARGCDDKAGSDARSNLALFLIDIAADEPRGRGISDAACYSLRPLEVLAFLEKHAVKFPKNTLHCAAYVSTVRSVHTPAERIAIASFFLDHGADIEDRGVNGYFTPLMGAAAAEDLEMVKFLLSRGANPNARNAVGLNSVIAAANHCAYGAPDAELEPKQKPQLAMVEYLVQAGADPKLPSSAAGAREVELMRNCCSRKPHSPTQRRICEVFGL